ncbi:MAG: sulfide-dependent adenosine diphosphate thiazole synthase [Actinomycetota bacterium]|nr:sulfide-dependent adenosine diphosphate thiazole synthase [Actinomycetota bacterium]
MAELETKITKAIVESFTRDFLDCLEVDVAVAGAGPSGMTAAYFLAKEGIKVAVFERNLYVGGGMWGGGMLFPKIVVQEKARWVLDGFGVNLAKWDEGYFVADSVEVVSKCTASTLDAGVKVWVGMDVEDLIVHNDRAQGVVLNWHAVELAGMHVDPLALKAKLVIDATGHPAELVRTLERKIPGFKLTEDATGVPGERSMWAEAGEKEILGNTREVYPGLLVTGMSANAVFASPRMGAIFGGMFLSGKRAAELALGILEREKKGD